MYLELAACVAFCSLNFIRQIFDLIVAMALAASSANVCILWKARQNVTSKQEIYVGP